MARTIIVCVGSVLIAMQICMTSLQLAGERRSILDLSTKRGDAALDMLAAIHTQAMLFRGTTLDHDPAISAFNESMVQFSKANRDVRLWVVMGPKVLAYQAGNSSAEIEPPQDPVDRATLGSGFAQTKVHDGLLRLSRPVILGRGHARAQACASCHSNLMSISSGEVIGAYSVEVDMRSELAAWRGQIWRGVAGALATTLITLAMIWGLLSVTTLQPLTRLSLSTRRLARGDLDVHDVDDDRPDELGQMARALGTFRRALLAKQTLERRNAHMARHDGLTDLPNRISYNDHLDDMIAAADRTGGKVGVVGIDLNRFKEINDRHGHSVGDAVLKELAERMTALLEDGEFVARCGGDEFAACKRFSTNADLESFIRRLEGALSRNVILESLDLPVGASLGVALYPDDARSREQVLNNADLAMYRAKASLTDSVCYYEPAMDETVRARRALVADMRIAIDQAQFELHYQVQKSVTSGDVTGYEALLRWRHPVHGYIPPDHFIPVAEECGAIVEIGEWVLRQACREAASWDPNVRIAVNLSPVQLGSIDVVSVVRDILVETGLPARRLELEITESTIIADKLHALHVLRQLKSLGVSIAIDDFGTGYSSLDTLNAFPFDKIKIDRSFLSEAESRPQSRSIIRAILALGKSLEVPVLAEGVETVGQLALLRNEGCHEAQGYLLGRPSPMRNNGRRSTSRESNSLKA